MKKKFDDVYQFRITLKGIKPAVWRRIQVPDTYNFWDLHSFHLDDPTTGKQARIGMIFDGLDPFDDFDVVAEADQYISGWFLTENATASYLYDFGDYWEHEVRLEKIFPKEKGVSYPRCVGG